MHKVRFLRGKALSAARGSALVGAVALSAVMTLASLGYLQVVTTTSNNEIQGLHDSRAFQAAESGLNLATAWLQNTATPWPTGEGSVTALYSGLSINGVTVDVRDSVGAGGRIFMFSTATSPKLSYAKTVSWSVVNTPKPSSEYGMYMDNAYVLGGNNQGIRKVSLYDGPFHSNTALQLGNPGAGNECHFNDRVTVYNIDPSTGLPVSDMSHGTGHFGNDYRYGVEGGSGDWDDEFRSTYDGNASKIQAQFNSSGATSITLDNGDSGVLFGVSAGVPFYRYRNAAGTLTTVNYNAAVDLKLRVAGKGASVSGTVKGKVSLYTDAGHDIYLPGDLKYEDFQTASMSSTNTTTNSDYGWSNANVIGLYTGGNFQVAEGTHYLTGHLFSVGSAASTLRFDSDQKNKTKFYLFGSLAVSGFWDSGQGTNQATFKQLWDRREISAPGMGYARVDGSGNPLPNFVRSSWTEANTHL